MNEEPDKTSSEFLEMQKLRKALGSESISEKTLNIRIRAYNNLIEQNISKKNAIAAARQIIHVK